MRSFAHSVLSLSLAATVSLVSAALWATPPSGQGVIVLGTDWNSPTKCSDNNADSLSISEAKVGATVWAQVQDSGYYNWGYFGSSMTAPNDTFYQGFPTMCRWYSCDVGVSQPAEDRVKYCPPNASYDYWIPSGVSLTTPNDNIVDSHYGAQHVYKFNGRSLTVEGNVVHCSKGTSICDFGENVVLVSGAYSFPALGTKTSICSRGKATVTGKLFRFEAGGGMGSTRSDCFLDWSMSGAANAQFAFRHSAGNTATWRWCGDCSKYYGRCVVSSNNATASAYSILAISNSVFGGTIEVQKFEHLQSFGADAYVARAEIAEDATLDVAHGRTTIGELVLNGRMNFTTDASTLVLREGMTFGLNASVNLPATAQGPVITMPLAAAFDLNAFLAAVSRNSGSVRLTAAKVVDNGDGTKSVAVSAGANGTIVVEDDATIVGGDARNRVAVAAGKTLDLVNGNGERMAVGLQENATVNIRRQLEDWSAVPTLWLDASAANTVSDIVIEYANSYYNYVGSGTYLKTGETFCDTTGNPFIRGWMDCRPGQTSVKLWNARYDQLYPNDNGNHNVMFGTHPRRVKGGLDGKDYIACDRPTPKAHLVFADGTVDDTVTPSPNALSRIYFTSYASAVTVEKDAAATQYPRYAFLVFGSANGGGGALLGGNAKFVRGGTAAAHVAADPIFATNETGAKVWLDGAEVDPTKSGFTRDWQVVTVDFRSTSNAFDGLGYGSSNNSGDNGGQNYAEIILVDQELSERQRQTIEIYLAEKWGLNGQYNYPDWAKSQFATVYGAGTVNLEADATLGGAFKGTVILNGNDLVIDGVALPPTATAIDTTDCVGWFDPDDATTCSYVNQADKNPSERLMWLYDRLGKADGRYALTGNQSSRSPWIDASAHGFGPVRRWVDYSNDEVTGGGQDGNTLRFRLMQGGAGTGNVVSNAFKTLIMVQDSTRGGGQPFVDGNNVLGAGSRLYAERREKAASSPIYPSGTSAVLTGGRTYLDGVEVDGSTTGFSGHDEILTVVPNGKYAPVCFAYLYNSQGFASRAESYGECQGEILMWDRVLGDAERKVAEAYLAYKWQGLANEGYSALTEATVTGAGMVTAASTALLPKFDANFSGLVSVPLDKGLAFTLATDGAATTVEGALDLGGGALEIPAGVSAIDVSIAKSGTKPKAGSYKLIGWATKPAVTWNLSLDGWTHENCALRAADDGLYLDLGNLGMLLIFR